MHSSFLLTFINRKPVLYYFTDNAVSLAYLATFYSLPVYVVPRNPQKGINGESGGYLHASLYCTCSIHQFPSGPIKFLQRHPGIINALVTVFRISVHKLCQYPRNEAQRCRNRTAEVQALA